MNIEDVIKEAKDIIKQLGEDYDTSELVLYGFVEKIAELDDDDKYG